MENYQYFNPVKLRYGTGIVDEVGQAIAPYGNRVLLVYGREHLKKNGTYDRITESLRKAKLSWIDLPGVQPNPRVELVREGVQICKKEKVDFILAVGGGSTSDTVKAIAFAANANFDVWLAYRDFHNLMHGNKVETPHVPGEVIPFGVIMTKPGTGSEFDYTSVLSNPETSEKLMVIDKRLYAQFAFHDPELTFTLPQCERAYGVADIMSHYLEQYFSSTLNTLILDRTKEAGLRTVIEAGKRVFENSSDQSAQSNLLYCAAWACSDQSMSGINGEWAAHMIEHEITAITDLNHGHGMAIIYPAWMRYVLATIPAKFARFATEVWGIAREGRSDLELGSESIRRTEDFWRSLGISLSLKDAGVSPSLFPRIAQQAVRFGSVGSIKALHQPDVERILENTLA